MKCNGNCRVSGDCGNNENREPIVITEQERDAITDRIGDHLIEIWEISVGVGSLKRQLRRRDILQINLQKIYACYLAPPGY